MQCKTWPFWPSLLASKENWEDAGESGPDGCPGINKGVVVSFDSITAQLNETLEASQKYL